MESIPEPSPARQMDDVPQLSARTETNQPHYSPRRLTDPHHHYHPHFSPTCRPLSSHTPLGSPLHTAARLRSHSMGSLPMGAWPIDPAAPVSPLTGKFTAPLLPTLQPPPEHSETHKVMEAAVAAERTRSKKLEEEEATLTADELRAVLRRERHRTGRIAAELAALKASAVHAQLESEMIEEGRINSLMRRLDTLNQEKGRLVNELEREEEMVRADKRLRQSANADERKHLHTCLLSVDQYAAKEAQ